MLSAGISSSHARSACFKGTFSNFEFMPMVSIRVRKWCLCSGYTSLPDAYAQWTHQFLARMLRVCISSWCSACFEWTALCAHISTWRICSVLAPVPDLCAQCTHQFLTHMLWVCISSWHACSVHASVPYSHADVIQNEHLKNRKLMCMLSMRGRNLCIWSGCALRISSWHVHSANLYAQRAHKGWNMRVKNSIFLIIFKVPKTGKIIKK